MEIEKTDIEGVILIRPKVYTDERGYFMETFSDRWFRENVADVDFVQDNESRSTFGVIRGLHFQRPPFAQGKLVRCTRGKVLDIALDIRSGSPTYGHWVSAVLSDENKCQFYVPEGFAHGFAVLSGEAVFQYKCTNYYHPEAEGGIALDSVGIEWLIPAMKRIISAKDLNHVDFCDFKTPF